MYEFPGLREGETIIFFVRKKWTAYIQVVLKFVINIAILLTIVNFLVDKFPSDSLAYLLLMEVCIFYLLAVWWVTYNGWLDEALDTFIITSQRVIDTTQSAFLSIEIASADLDQVQDVKGKVAGFLGGFLHFGHLDVQTAASKNVFHMNHVENPERYINEIIELKRKYVTEKNGG